MMLRRKIHADFFLDSGTSDVPSDITKKPDWYKPDDETKNALLESIRNLKLGLEHTFSSKQNSTLYVDTNNNDDIIDNDSNEEKDDEDDDSLYLINEKINKQIKKNKRTSKNHQDKKNSHTDNKNGNQMSAKKKDLLFAKVILLYICLY
jgi:hypothetical protein